MIRVAAALARQLPSLAAARSDGALLAEFLTERNEAAFAELVRRHGPLVWAACRRLLPDPADAEDAFQAAFLVLVRRANRLTAEPVLGPWLYRVAAFTARNLRRRNARAFARRVPLAAEVPGAAPPSPDLRFDLDAALLALPEKYRTPLILCHLQGWSRREAAARLGCPEGTLSSLLARGLIRLRARLQSHDPTAALVAVGTVIPAALAASTVTAACASRVAAAGLVSASVSQLVEGVVHMFWVKKATAATFALVVVFGFGLGMGVSVRDVPRAAAEDATAPPSRDPQPVRIAASAADLDAMKVELVALEAELQAHLKLVETVAVRIAELKAVEGLDPKRVAEMRASYDEALKRAQMVEDKRDEVKNRLRALQERGKAVPPPLPVAPPAPKPPIPAAAADLVKQIAALEQQLQASARRADALKAEQAALQAEVERLAAQREQLRQMQVELAKKRPIVPAVNLLNLKPAGYFELTVGGKTAQWAFVIREVGAGEKVVGNTACENAAVLGKFLSRAAKDASGPREVRIKASAGTPQDSLVQTLDAIARSGLSVSSIDMSAAAGRTAETDRSVLDLFEAEVRQLELVERQRREAERRQAENEKLREYYNRLKKKEDPNLPPPPPLLPPTPIPPTKP